MRFAMIIVLEADADHTARSAAQAMLAANDMTKFVSPAWPVTADEGEYRALRLVEEA